MHPSTQVLHFLDVHLVWFADEREFRGRLLKPADHWPKDLLVAGHCLALANHVVTVAAIST
ncbi:MAG: hypothetical protein ACYDAG_07260 [Chloroflexota bacterium]